jgi:hypothetical protein
MTVDQLAALKENISNLKSINSQTTEYESTLKQNAVYNFI